jgi:hypothetical protein
MEPALSPGDRLLARGRGPRSRSVVVFRRADGKRVKRAVGCPARIDPRTATFIDGKRLEKPEVAGMREPRALPDAPSDERRIGAPRGAGVAARPSRGRRQVQATRGLFADDPGYFDPAGRPEPRAMPRPLARRLRHHPGDDLRKAGVDARRRRGTAGEPRARGAAALQACASSPWSGPTVGRRRCRRPVPGWSPRRWRGACLVTGAGRTGAERCRSATPVSVVTSPSTGTHYTDHGDRRVPDPGHVFFLGVTEQRGLSLRAVGPSVENVGRFAPGPEPHRAVR